MEQLEKAWNVEIKPSHDQQNYFEEYLNIKTDFEKLLVVNKSLIEKQQEYNCLESEYKKVQKSNKEMEVELTETRQKLISIENKSFEIPVKDKEKDDLKTEIGRLNHQISLLKTDLEETTTSYDKLDEKYSDLETQNDIVSTRLLGLNLDNFNLNI